MVVQENKDDSEFLNCTVYCQLITTKDPKFETVATKMFGEVPKEENIILPFFDISFDNFMPTGKLNEMIQTELDNYVEQNQDIIHIIQSTDMKTVINSEPELRPYSKSFAVGDVAVTPDQTGIIADFDFSEVKKLCEGG